jgi:uncharacterized protein YciI
MKRRLGLLRFAVLPLLLSSVGAANGQQQEEKFDMGRMQVVLLSKVAGWKGDENSVVEAQKKFLRDLVESGGVALAGEILGEDQLKAVLVFKTESKDEAIAKAQALPAVQSGMLTADVITWFAARNLITPPNKPLTRSNYIFGVFVRGPKWTPEVTDATKKIQEGHLANITRLYKEGKVVLAGPFDGGGEKRGILIFKVDSIAEADALAATDPAVMAGRLKIDLHRWSVPAGMLR